MCARKHTERSFANTTAYLRTTIYSNTPPSLRRTLVFYLSLSTASATRGTRFRAINHYYTIMFYSMFFNLPIPWFPKPGLINLFTIPIPHFVLPTHLPKLRSTLARSFVRVHPCVLRPYTALASCGGCLGRATRCVVEYMGGRGWSPCGDILGGNCVWVL